ncbi:alpha-galactosidase [Catenulispora sp. MAP12-49]|uniref:alpha-galactosidase n=1 Tax=Catenulispora sp. MAP12-49 TaxID=3156302 RepID=UPI003516E6A8
MTLIRSIPGARAWLVTAGGSCAVLRLDARDRLLSAHWGRELGLEQAAALIGVAAPVPAGVSGASGVSGVSDVSAPGFGAVGHGGAWPFEEDVEGPLELAAGAAFHFGHAQLAVRFADGTRDLELDFAGASIENPDDTTAELVLSFADRHYPLAVESRHRVRRGSPVIERRLVLRHTGPAGGEQISILRADSASWTLPPLPDYRLSQVRGRWAAETRLNRSSPPFGETLLTSRRGITGHHANPWVMIDDGTAGATHGQVFGCALAWSGSWQITVERTSADRTVVAAGFGPDGAVWPLAPGEVLTTPVSAGIWTDGGFDAASQAWHGYVLDRVLPHAGELRPVVYNSWEATGFDVSLEGQLALARQAADLGVELFVMDDGWFGSRTSDRAGLGDWWPNPDRFPDGLAPLVKGVRELGMDFGLWVEPEMVNPDSDLYREHPDWILHQPFRQRSEHRNQLVLNLARPDVAAWVHGWLDRLVAENDIGFLKWDMNRPFTEVGWPEAGPGGGDLVWRGYVENLYALLDRLRADHPALRIESCSGGGGRLDAGMLARVDQVWTSDNTDALDRLAIQEGFAHVYPARVMSAWVTDSPNPHTGRRIPLEFRFHVAMAGVLGIGGDLAEWSEAELATAREMVSVYKRIRPVVQHGVRYAHGDASGDLSGVEYVTADRSEAVVFVYRRERRFAQMERPIVLRGVDAAGRYRDVGSGIVHHGAVLLSRGLPVALGGGDPMSTMVHLVREG